MPSSSDSRKRRALTEFELANQPEDGKAIGLAVPMLLFKVIDYASPMTAIGPTLPSAASAAHGSYLRISCRQWVWRTTVKDDPARIFRV
jgi:hypothetical protein